MDSLAAAFEGTNSAKERIEESVHWDTPNPEAARHVDYVLGAVARFKHEMDRRGLTEFYERDISLIEYPLGELRKFFLDEESGVENRNAAYIYAHFVGVMLAALQHLAEEIDADNAA